MAEKIIPLPLAGRGKKCRRCGIIRASDYYNILKKRNVKRFCQFGIFFAFDRG